MIPEAPKLADLNYDKFPEYVRKLLAPVKTVSHDFLSQ